jgi:hypothetical protein
MNVVRAAQEQFLRVPADIRARFSHDPGLFTEFLENPDNLEEAVRMGLAVKRPDPVPEPAPVKS